jgi:hypothetical protein
MHIKSVGRTKSGAAESGGREDLLLQDGGGSLGGDGGAEEGQNGALVLIQLQDLARESGRGRWQRVWSVTLGRMVRMRG